MAMLSTARWESIMRVTKSQVTTTIKDATSGSWLTRIEVSLHLMLGGWCLVSKMMNLNWSKIQIPPTN